MSVPKKHVRTLEERLKIVEEVEKNSGEKRIDIAKRLGLAPSTLNSIIAKKDTIRGQAEKYCDASKRKTGKESSFAELERVLFAWYQQALASNIPVDGTILRKKGKMIAAQLKIKNFTASNGWIMRFKDRHGIVLKKNAKKNLEVDSENPKLWLERLQYLLAGYEPHNIYCAHETGLYYNAIPDKTSPSEEEESSPSWKNFKDKFTVLLCVNGDGSDKQVPIIIGKAQNPHCLKNVKKLPAIYHNNSKAWMTTDIFSTFLYSFDINMVAQNRNILLFVDNCSEHPKDTSFLRNVKVIQYPAKFTNELQPLELGITKCFKHFYRKRFVQTVACLMDAGKDIKKKINVLEAMHYCVAAWQQVPLQMIRNCFQKAGYTWGQFSEDSDALVNDDHFYKDWEKFSGLKNDKFEDYVALDSHVATSGVETVQELCENLGVSGSGNVKEENEPEVVPNFAEIHEALTKVRSFFYAHSTSYSDLESVLNLEKMYFELRGKLKT